MRGEIIIFQHVGYEREHIEGPRFGAQLSLSAIADH